MAEQEFIQAGFSVVGTENNENKHQHQNKPVKTAKIANTVNN